jgi:hypothetical protein
MRDYSILHLDINLSKGHRFYNLYSYWYKLSKFYFTPYINWMIDWLINAQRAVFHLTLKSVVWTSLSRPMLKYSWPKNLISFSFHIDCCYFKNFELNCIDPKHLSRRRRPSLWYNPIIHVSGIIGLFEIISLWCFVVYLLV